MKKKFDKTKIVSPDSPNDKIAYQKRKMRKKCRSRAAVEPIIGHTKHDHRMPTNYLKETSGNAINAMMAGTALNFKRLIRLIEKEGKHYFVTIRNNPVNVIYFAITIFCFSIILPSTLNKLR